MSREVQSLIQVNFTSPSKKESEDSWIINEEADVYGVLDGATPLCSFHDEDGHNGAYLAARLFKSHFEALHKQDRMVRAMIEANQKLYQQMVDYQVDVSKGYKRWSTCVAAIKVGTNEVEYVQLGDSMVIVGYQDDTCEVVTEDTVKGISQRAKEQRERDRENGLGVPDESLYDQKLERLRYNRSMANVEHGYTVANGMEEVADFIQTGKLPKRDMRDILILSDGLFHPELTLKDTYRRICNIGLEAYIYEVTRWQEERSRHIDDRTAIWLHF